jgi:hypothetical protein
MRSPNYPAYGLAETIEMAKAIWSKEERTIVSPEVAVKALGYQSLNGTARTKLASLRKFGLLEEVKNGGVRISDLAMKLIHHEADSVEYRDGIKEAALKPALYQEVYASHAKASDDAIRAFLKVKKAFSESGARQFVEAFRETLKLANLNGEAYTPGVNGRKPGKTPAVGDTVQWESQGVLQFSAPRRVRALTDDGEWAFVDGSDTGLPVKELTVTATPPPSDPKGTQKTSVKPPTLPEYQGSRQDVFSLSEGQVTLNWPATLSQESYEDLTAWLDIVKRKIGRSIKVEQSA